MNIKQKIYNFLRWSQKYTLTDMVYLVKGGFWWIFGKACIFFIALATMSAFAHWTTKETFGTYQYVLSTFAILAIFALPGMNTALVRTVAQGYEGMLLLCAKTKLRWALIGTGTSFIISAWYLFHQNFVLGISFLIVAVFLPFMTTFNLFSTFWQGKQKFDIQSKYLILINALTASVLIPVIFFLDNLIVIVFTYFAFRSLLETIFFKLTLKRISNQREEKKAISFGKHLTLIEGAVMFGNRIDAIIIWQFLGPVAVAIYAFAQLPILKMKELAPISSLALPKLSKKNIKEIKSHLFKKFLKLFLVSTPFALFYILLAPYFFKVFFPSYLESVFYSQILALTLILLPFLLLETSLVAEMKKKELYTIQFATPFLKIVLFLTLVPLYEIWGVIYAILLAQIFNGGLLLYFFKKI